MTETVTCPADGCDYEGVQSSVLGHYSGKRDDAHSGGYERARQRLGLSDDDSAASDKKDSPDDGGGGGGGGNPTFGSADDSGGTSNTKHELPCGHESFDMDEAPDPPFEVTCSQCGQSWVVNE